MLLEELRDKSEIIKYFKAQNVNITDEDIEQLKEQYKDISLDVNNLTFEQLSKVAGGELHLVIRERKIDMSYRRWGGTGSVIRKITSVVEPKAAEHTESVGSEKAMTCDDDDNRSLTETQQMRRNNDLSSARVEIQTYNSTIGTPVQHTKDIDLVQLAYRPDLAAIRAAAQKSSSELKVVPIEQDNGNSQIMSKSTKPTVHKRASSTDSEVQVETAITGKGEVPLADIVHNRLCSALLETVNLQIQDERYKFNSTDTFLHKMTFDGDGKVIIYSGPGENYTFAEHVFASDKISWEQKLLYLFYPDGEKLKLKPWTETLLSIEGVRTGLANIFQEMAESLGVSEANRQVSVSYGASSKTLRVQVGNLDCSMELNGYFDFNALAKVVFGDENSEALSECNRLMREAIGKVKDIVIETTKEKVIEYTKKAVGTVVTVLISVLLLKLGININNNDKK